MSMEVHYSGKDYPTETSVVMVGSSAFDTVISCVILNKL